jgi:hypothetical protein
MFLEHYQILCSSKDKHHNRKKKRTEHFLKTLILSFYPPLPFLFFSFIMYSKKNQPVARDPSPSLLGNLARDGEEPTLARDPSPSLLGNLARDGLVPKKKQGGDGEEEKIKLFFANKKLFCN